MATRLLGLTGSIATGKSTVAQMLSDLGAELIDADLIARELVAPGQPAVVEIAAAFPGVVAADGTLDRPRLAERIFSSSEERQTLNAITHPKIQAEVTARIKTAIERGAPVVIYDAALLIENGLQQTVEGVIVVTAPPLEQRKRLLARDRLTPAQADARIAAQMAQEEKLKFATWVIDNGGSLLQTQLQVDALWEQVRSAA